MKLYKHFIATQDRNDEWLDSLAELVECFDCLTEDEIITVMIAVRRRHRISIDELVDMKSPTIDAICERMNREL